MPPRVLHHVELPELRSASALLANLRYECRTLLAVKRSPEEPRIPVYPGEDAAPEARLAWLQEYGKIERRWHGDLAERVVRGLRFTGTSWTPALPELSVGVLKWAEAVLAELAAADEAVQRLEDDAARSTATVDRLQSRVREIEHSAILMTAERDGLKRQISELQQALTISQAAESAWQAAAKASGDAASTVNGALQVLQVALRMPPHPSPAHGGELPPPISKAIR